MSFFGFGPDVNFISKGTIFLQQQQPQSEAWEEVFACSSTDLGEVCEPDG